MDIKKIVQGKMYGFNNELTNYNFNVLLKEIKFIVKT